MSLFTRIRSAIRAQFRRARAERELEAELRFHLEMEAQSHQRAGETPGDSQYAALRSFGGVEQVKEKVRDAWGTRMIDQLRQDLAYGFRGLRHSPGFAAVVVLTLALGIGANTAIFSIVEGVLLRRLPYRAPNRLVTVTQAAPKAGQSSLGFSVPDFMDFRARNRAFVAMSEYHSMWFILLGRSEPERVQTGVVSDNFFDMLGVKPLLGRTFLPGEDKPGAAPVLVLSYDYWQRSFGGDPHVVGRVFEMNNKPHTVVGVLPPLPAFPNHDEVFMPASACPFRGAPNMITNRQGRMISHVIARLKDDVTRAQALDDVRRVGVELCGAFPSDYPTADGYTVDLDSLSHAFTGNARAPLLVLLATSVFVLLIACANVANLALARLVRRDRELAVRTALGASRGRIFRQLIVESLLLSMLGGLAGLALAAGGLHLLVGYAAHFLPRVDEIGINGPVLLFTAAVSVGTGLLFGTRASLPRADRLAETLKDGARGSGARRHRLRALLVVGQVAISVPLLVGAGLAARSLLKLQHVDPGLETNRVLAANISLNWTRYNDPTKTYGFWDRAMTEAARIPGVQSVAVSGYEPLNGLVNQPTPFHLEHQPASTGDATPHATGIVVSEDYFATVGQPLLRGRTFRSSDDAKAPVVIVINQALARRYWHDQDPVGQRVTFDNGKTWATIVGVVANTREQIDTDPVEEIYAPLRIVPGMNVATVLVRTSVAPSALTQDLRAAIRRVDPQQPVTSIETIAHVRDASLAPRKLIATLLGLFAALALVITAAGIGGVLAFSVSQRTNEIGIRMALGAGRADVLWMVLREGLLLVAVGLALGTTAALLLGRLATSVLYGVEPGDPATLVCVGLVLLGVAAAACLLPARRATAVNPLVALREN